MSESVVFNFGEFSGLYPELNAEWGPSSAAFENATMILNNTPNSIVKDECERKKLLYLLTAHLMTLLKRGAGNVGTLGNASEGSVSVGYSTASIDKLNAGWFGQTQYGLMFWMATAKYRSGFYVSD